MTITITDAVVHPARQADVEAWLTSLGVEWRFDPDLPLARIDQAAGLANQVRHDPLHEEVVDRYAGAMVDGAQFPPIIATDLDQPVPLGGNHRVAAAARARRSTMPAYLVAGTEAQLRRVRFEDNARHGLPPSNAERIEHAVALMADGFGVNDAARIVGIAAAKLTTAAAVRRAEERATAAGIEGFGRLAEGVRYSLSQIDNDIVFTEAAELTLTASLPIGDVRSLVRACLAVDPSEALRLIGAEAEDHQQRARDRAGNVRASSRTARARFDNALAEIRGLVPIDVYDTCPNDDVRAVLAQRIMDAAKVLHETHTLLTKGPGE